MHGSRFVSSTGASTTSSPQQVPPPPRAHAHRPPPVPPPPVAAQSFFQSDTQEPTWLTRAIRDLTIAVSFLVLGAICGLAFGIQSTRKQAKSATSTSSVIPKVVTMRAPKFSRSAQDDHRSPSLATPYQSGSFQRPSTQEVEFSDSSAPPPNALDDWLVHLPDLIEGGARRSLAESENETVSEQTTTSERREVVIDSSFVSIASQHSRPVFLPEKPESLAQCEDGSCSIEKLDPISPNATSAVPTLPDSDDTEPTIQGTLGTLVNWQDSPADAYEAAKEEDKLVFLIHVSGNFEIPGFT